jgi:hypothetical protein
MTLWWFNWSFIKRSFMIYWNISLLQPPLLMQWLKWQLPLWQQRWWQGHQMW